MLRSFLTAFCAASTTVLAGATTHVVDDTPGPGVDFREISDAIAAAAPGDLVIVHPGIYLPFTLDKGLVLLGLGSGGSNVARVLGTIRVVNVPADARAVVSRIDADATLAVDGCAGTVVLDDLEAEGARISRSADVRANHLLLDGHPVGQGGMLVTDSRVECVVSQILPGAGQSGSVFGPAGSGGIGLIVGDGARVHLVTSIVLGGPGGDAELPTQLGGDGGVALKVLPSSELLLAGAPTLRGGDGGRGPSYPTSCVQGGSGAAGIVNLGGRVRLGISPAGSIEGGVTDVSAQCDMPTTAPAIRGMGVLVPPLPDPALAIFPPFTIGGTSTLAVGPVDPGDVIVVVLSRRMHVVPTPGVVVEDLVPVENLVGLASPSLPGQTVTNTLTLPLGLTPGTLLAAQATITSPNGVRRTNSFVSVLR